MPRLTVITPTYNRAGCLEACWESLKRQSCTDFQWLIVDDGSTDDTAAVVAGFRESKPEFIVDYVSKENGGKHTALNAAHPHICGEYVVILDSDDRFVDTAIEEILRGWQPYEENSEVGRLIFLKGYTQEEPICYVEHENAIVDTLIEPRIGITGRDCCDTFRTELFVKHPFPVFPGERFLGEGAAFFFMELESKGVYVNKVIYLCDYREDGLTKAGKKMRLMNPLGGRYNSMVYMHKRLPMKTRLKKAMLYVCYSKFAGIGLKKTVSDNEHKMLTVLALIPGWALYIYWKRRYFS